METPQTLPWSAGRLVVVLDIGKSNAKLVLLDPLTGTEWASCRRANAPVAGAIRQLDLAGLEQWLLQTLAALPERHRIGAIVPVAHGASCVMLDQAGRPLLAPDYEDPVLAQQSAAYESRRDPFARSLSPSLPAGLNIGRQIDFVQRFLPSLFAQVRTILTYPQYWAFVLSGVLASEVTSLGCHTDLWLPAEARLSALAEASGWRKLFPPLRPAADRLGPLRPELAQHCGLPADCVVLCGIHDSNASYLRHRVERDAATRFSVVSSGTWTVVLSNGSPPGLLRAERDMLANVDAYGALVGTARFMGGRDYLAVAGEDPPEPDLAGLWRAVDADAQVWPSLSPGGQFIGRSGRIVGADALDRHALAALASLYVALLTDVALDLLAAEGDIVIDGPLARNPLYAGLIASLRPGSTVRRGDGGAGSVAGACCLLGLDGTITPESPPVAPLSGADRLRGLRDRWAAQL